MLTKKSILNGPNLSAKAQAHHANRQVSWLGGLRQPLYSGGTAPDLHRLPFSPRPEQGRRHLFARIQLHDLQLLRLIHHDSIPLPKKECFFASATGER